MASVESILNSLKEQKTVPDWQQLLSEILKAFDCSTGTIHVLDDGTQLLKLRAKHGIPDSLSPKLDEIPIGKGMAGIAAERRQPVELCNLQTDGSGVARPAARDAKVEGSIAAPMVMDDRLFGTLGIAKPVSYDFTEEENHNLMQIGEELSRILHRSGATGL